MVNQRIEYNPPDKNDILYKAKLFTDSVETFLQEYDKIMVLPVSFDRGVQVAQTLNKIHSALVMWKLDLDFWYRQQAVKQMTDDYNKRFDK